MGNGNITEYYGILPKGFFILLLQIFYVYLLAENKYIITYNKRTWWAFFHYQQRGKAFKNS